MTQKTPKDWTSPDERWSFLEPWTTPESSEPKSPNPVHAAAAEVWYGHGLVSAQGRRLDDKRALVTAHLADAVGHLGTACQAGPLNSIPAPTHLQGTDRALLSITSGVPPRRIASGWPAAGPAGPRPDHQPRKRPRLTCLSAGVTAISSGQPFSGGTARRTISGRATDPAQRSLDCARSGRGGLAGDPRLHLAEPAERGAVLPDLAWSAAAGHSTALRRDSGGGHRSGLRRRPDLAAAPGC
jgi:hypothetical protein